MKLKKLTYPKDLFMEYVEYFGPDPPYPPEHIMRELVRMKKEGTYDETMERFKPMAEELIKTIELLTNEPLHPDHPFFQIDPEKPDPEKKSKKIKKKTKKTAKASSPKKSTEKSTAKTNKTKTNLKKKPKTASKTSSRTVKSKKAK